MQILLQGALPPMGFEAITVSTAAVALTTATYQVSVDNGGSKDRVTAKLATITVETDSIRVRFDGTAPTSTNGHLFQAGDVIELVSMTQVKNFKAIRSSAAVGDAKLMVTYWGA